jgi:long-chain acyl-CoA synthetase
VTANLADLAARAAVEATSGQALVEARSGAATTWSELDDLVERTAAGLELLGTVAGNRVLIALGNRTELVVAYLGVLRARQVAVPVDPASDAQELRRIARDCGARLIVADPGSADAARATGVPVVMVGGTPGTGERAFEDLLAPVPDVLPALRDAEALAALLYTSRDVEPARGAMLTHRALLANVTQVAAVEPPMVRSGDVVYGAVPLFHVAGLNGVLGQVLLRGATLVIADRFDAHRALDDVQRHGVTVLPVPPSVLAQWRSVDDLADRLGGVRLVVSGASPLPAELVAELRERHGLEVHQGYGLTEAGPVITSTLSGGVDAGGARKDASVGAPLPGVSLRVVDETGRPVGRDDCGQIEIAGDNLFGGYWPDGADGPVEGWLATGDLGYVDADGDLFLVDRLEELVVVSGFTVYPSEVEDVVSGVPGVIEAAVTGEPDPETGQAVVVHLRVARDHPDPEEVERQVVAACRERLARFKWPARVHRVAVLPHTAGGRVERRRLGDQ